MHCPGKRGGGVSQGTTAFPVAWVCGWLSALVNSRPSPYLVLVSGGGGGGGDVIKFQRQRRRCWGRFLGRSDMPSVSGSVFCVVLEEEPSRGLWCGDLRSLVGMLHTRCLQRRPRCLFAWCMHFPGINSWNVECGRTWSCLRQIIIKLYGCIEEFGQFSGCYWTGMA